MSVFTDRQQREREYYNEFATGFNPDSDIHLEPIIGGLRKEFNPYWRLYHFASDNYSQNAKLLDFGCGVGENAIRFAHIGYDVYGFDVADKNIELSQILVEKHGFTGKMFFEQAAAEALPYEDNFFDIIVGVDILHHTEIEKAVLECKRVLKQGGQAIFKEPLYSSLFDSIRNLKGVRRFFPNSASLTNHITEDEQKLSSQNIEFIKNHFTKVEVIPFRVFTRIEKLMPFLSSDILEKFDSFLLQRLPFLSSLAGEACIVVQK